LNFNLSSLQDNDLHYFRAPAAACAVLLTLTLAMLLSTAAKGPFSPVLLMWVLLLPKAALSPGLMLLLMLREAILQQLHFKR